MRVVIIPETLAIHISPTFLGVFCLHTPIAGHQSSATVALIIDLIARVSTFPVTAFSDELKHSGPSLKKPLNTHGDVVSTVTDAFDEAFTIYSSIYSI